MNHFGIGNSKVIVRRESDNGLVKQYLFPECSLEGRTNGLEDLDFTQELHSGEIVQVCKGHRWDFSMSYNSYASKTVLRDILEIKKYKADGFFNRDGGAKNFFIVPYSDAEPVGGAIAVINMGITLNWKLLEQDEFTDGYQLANMLWRSKFPIQNPFDIISDPVIEEYYHVEDRY